MGRTRLVTLREFLAMMADETGKPLARSTYDVWHATGKAPRRIKLPNGRIAFRDSDIDRWLEEREQPGGEAA